MNGEKWDKEKQWRRLTMKLKLEKIKKRFKYSGKILVILQFVLLLFLG